MIYIDGSQGEGGGQIVRTALALSTLTGTPFTLTDIRGRRPKPGLKAQHLTAIQSLKKICGAKTNALSLGLRDLVYEPGIIQPGTYEVRIGTAGSISLVLQALLIPLMFASGETVLRISGGTCGKWQAPVEYLEWILLPYLFRFAGIDFQAERLGYFPKGGGIVNLRLLPRFEKFTGCSSLLPFDLSRKGGLLRIEGVSHASESLRNRKVAERQADAASEMLKQLEVELNIEVVYGDSLCAGSGITLRADFGNSTNGYPLVLGTDALGERGKSAERVGQEAARKLWEAIYHPSPVDEFLADQLVPFLALIPGSEMQVPRMTGHLHSNMEIVEMFLPVRFVTDGKRVRVEPAFTRNLPSYLRSIP
jgi:RNA 3'-phosphate cyclase